MSVERIRIHFVYVVVILTTTIVIVATDRWSGKANFTEYLSNVATMTSLLLGLVAIFYSFVANDGLSRSLGSISTVSDEVRSSKEQIAKYVEVTSESAKTATENAHLLQSVSADVSRTLASLGETLRVVSDESHNLQALVSSLPPKLDQLETKVGDVAKALGTKEHVAAPSGGKSLVSDAMIDHFLARASLAENLVVYACILAAKSEKPLSTKAFSEAIGLNVTVHLAGFLSCMDSLQLLSAERTSGPGAVFEIRDVSRSLVKKTRSYFVDYVAKEFADDEPEKAKWMSRLQRVDDLMKES
jgi:hypothetical protein